MNTVYRFCSTVPYSLHDMRVRNMELTGDNLRFHFEYGYLELKDNFRQVDGNLLIEKVSMNFSDVCFLSENGAYGKFIGERMELADFLKKYSDYPFEVMDETYGENTVVYRGYLSLPDRTSVMEMIMSLYYKGNLVYEVKE